MNELSQAFQKLKTATKTGVIRLKFELEHDHWTGYSVPIYQATHLTNNYENHAVGGTPQAAVNRLLKKLGITTVEQYIRTKAAYS